MPGSNQNTTSAFGRYAILTDHGDTSLFRGSRYRIDPQWCWLKHMRGNRFLKGLRSCISAASMFARSRKFKDPVVVVTYGSSTGLFFALFQHLVRGLWKPRTHLMFDFLLDAPRRGPMQLIDRVKTMLFNQAITAAAIWGKTDVHRFAEAHGLLREKLVFHPYHITLDDLGRE